MSMAGQTSYEMQKMWVFYEIKVHFKTGFVPFREMVIGMNKQEVVKLMTDYINNMNRGLAMQANMPQEKIEEALRSSTPQLVEVNGRLYDLLSAHGVIK